MNLRIVAVVLCAALLGGCIVNEGASFEDGDDSISLLREQVFFWKEEVNQELVLARDKECQTRVEFPLGSKRQPDIEVLESRPALYVLHQGRNWYAVSTEECRMQKFDVPPDVSKLTPRGRFAYSADGTLGFQVAKQD